MKYMLDTNTCIFAINGNPFVRTRFAREYPFGLAISTITEAELCSRIFPADNSIALHLHI